MSMETRILQKNTRWRIKQNQTIEIFSALSMLKYRYTLSYIAQQLMNNKFILEHEYLYILHYKIETYGALEKSVEY